MYVELKWWDCVTSMVYMSKDDDDGDDDKDDECIQHSLWTDITINEYFRWLIVGMKSKASVHIFFVTSSNHTNGNLWLLLSVIYWP